MPDAIVDIPGEGGGWPGGGGWDVHLSRPLTGLGPAGRLRLVVLGPAPACRPGSPLGWWLPGRLPGCLAAWLPALFLPGALAPWLAIQSVKYRVALKRNEQVQVYDLPLCRVCTLACYAYVLGSVVAHVCLFACLWLFLYAAP